MSDTALLQEVLGFLHDPKQEARALAIQEILPYSAIRDSRHVVFKQDNMRAIDDLKRLVLDMPQIAHNALKILINLSQDDQIRARLLTDIFVNTLVAIITNTAHGLAGLACILLANMTKDDRSRFLIRLRSAIPDPAVSTSDLALNQLMDCFVRGADKKLNEYTTYDFLANVFADLTRFDEGRDYLLTPQNYDDIVPLSKLIVFTECLSQVRRTGVAAIIKNCCFDVSMHASLLDEAGINLLPYILLPLCAGDEFDVEENDAMFDELQFLPAHHQREPDHHTMTMLIEALVLLSTQRSGRDQMRRRQVYPIIRQLHLAHGEDESLNEACEKLVNVLMRDGDADSSREALPSAQTVPRAPEALEEL
ncbi:Protein hgh1 [Savitreella phatthalungensis]